PPPATSPPLHAALPISFPSPTLRALEKALEIYDHPARARGRYEYYAGLGRYVRGQLRELGLEPLAREEWASPVVTSFAPPSDESDRKSTRLNSSHSQIS